VEAAKKLPSSEVSFKLVGGKGIMKAKSQFELTKILAQK
jgi:hypothetical protein